jgi:hypothetical protein
MDREKLHRLLRLGIEKGASDIHFQVGYLPLYRFHGDLVELRYKVLTAQDTEAIARLLLEGDDRTISNDLNECDLAYELPNEGRYRVNISKQRRCYNIVLRVIPPQIRSFDDLNLPQDRHDRGPDRIRIHPRQEHHHPARARHRHGVVPRGPAGRPAPGPGCHHGGRDARPGDRRHVAQGGLF